MLSVFSLITLLLSDKLIHHHIDQGWFSTTPRHDVLRSESLPPTPPDLQSRKVSSRLSSRRRSVARVLWLVGFVLLAGYFALPGIKRSDGPSPSLVAKTRTVANTLTSNSPNANANVNTNISSAELARLTGGPARVVQKNIEDVVEGDRVIAWDDETGQQVVRPVVRTFKNVSDHLLVVRVRGSDGTTQEIKTTNEHPFWVPDKGWVSAKNLETGTRLVQSDGQSAQVELTSLDVKPKGTCVYNFEVMGAHNYYVAAQGVRGPPVLVHNKCATEGVSELLEKGGKKKVGKKASKQYLTYTAIEEGTGKIYTGRTSGPLDWTVEKILKRRKASHHRKNIGDLMPDEVSRSYDAIRGREQLMIEANRKAGIAVDQINGISPRKKDKLEKFIKAAIGEWGNID